MATRQQTQEIAWPEIADSRANQGPTLYNSLTRWTILMGGVVALGWAPLDFYDDVADW